MLGLIILLLACPVAHAEDPVFYEYKKRKKKLYSMAGY